MVGIIQDPRGHPVRQDPLGTPAEVKTGSYLLDDGVSLEAPIPVVIVTGSSYVDSAGNLRGVLPMNITGLTAPPVNTALPAITGTPRVGQVLSGSTGTWTGTPTPTYTRQWLRNGTAISGATGANYTLVSADAGATISLRVTATNSAGNATATSAATAAVNMTPANTAAPVVTGDLTVGSVLTTTNGTWSGTPAPAIARAWQWSVNGTSGWTTIPGQIGATYTTTEDDADYYVRCLVTATNSAGTASTASNVVGPIVEPSVNWDWQVFTLRTGDSGAWIGYSNGDIVSPPFNPPVGTITNEPTAITQLEAIFQDASGDIVAVLQGDWRAYVSSVTMSFDAEPLTYQGYSLQGGNTFMRFSGFSETVAVDTDYTVEFG